MWQFIINNIGWISGVLSALIGILGTILGVKIKGSNAEKVLKGLSAVTKQLPTFIRQAEKVSTDPAERLAFALNQAILSCQAQGFTPNDQQITDFTDQINDQVKLSKDINIFSKNKTTLNTVVEIKPIGGINREN